MAKPTLFFRIVAFPIYLQVDASEQHWPVQFPEGIDIAKRKTAIQNLR